MDGFRAMANAGKGGGVTAGVHVYLIDFDVIE